MSVGSNVGRQVSVGPYWAVSGTAEVYTPTAPERAAGLAIGGNYDYQLANWLYKTQAENLGKVREQVVFSDVAPGFYPGGAVPTTGASYTGVRISTSDHSSYSHFVSGLNTSATAYEVFGYANISAGTVPTIVSNTLPVGFTLNDIAADGLGTRLVLAVGASGTAAAAYIATAANTWSSVGASYFPAAPGVLRKVRKLQVWAGGGNTGYSFVLGDNGTVFMKQGFDENTHTLKTPPTGMSTVNFRDATLATSGGVPFALCFGNSRHVMTITISSPPTHNVSVISNALPVSVSSVNAAACLGIGLNVVAGGVRTDGKAFVGVSNDGGGTWNEVPPEVHGITAAITDMQTTVQGGVMAVAGGALFGGFPDDLSPWKKLWETGVVTDLAAYGGDYSINDETKALVGTRIIVGVAGTTPARIAYGTPRFYAERNFP